MCVYTGTQAQATTHTHIHTFMPYTYKVRNHNNKATVVHNPLTPQGLGSEVDINVTTQVS